MKREQKAGRQRFHIVRACPLGEGHKNGDGIAYGTNEWDVYPHNLSNVYIKFYRDKATPDYASATYYDYEVGSIAPRGFIRALYVLGDDNFNYSFYAVREGTDQYDPWAHVDPGSVYNGFTIKNQVEDPPTFFTFRGYSMWPGSGFIYVNPAYPNIHTVIWACSDD
jgi:hypothetical protein